MVVDLSGQGCELGITRRGDEWRSAVDGSNVPLGGRGLAEMGTGVVILGRLSSSFGCCVVAWRGVGREQCGKLAKVVVGCRWDSQQQAVGGQVDIWWGRDYT